MSEPTIDVHWVEGRVVDGSPAPRDAWARVAAVIGLLLIFDLVFALLPARAHERVDNPDPIGAAALRETLRAAAGSEHRSLLLVGDSVLAGDVLASSRPADWREHRVLEFMRRELGPRAHADVHQIALDGLLPSDALHLLTELDRIDPTGRVELVFEINLRYFSAQYAKQTECTRAAICELRDDTAQHWAVNRFAFGLVESAAHTREWLAAHMPVARHRDALEHPTLAAFDHLAIARAPVDADPTQLDTAALEAEARMREHYRSSKLSSGHAQWQALAQLLARLDARGRRAWLFMTPLADRFAAEALGERTLGRRYAAIAKLVNDFDNPELALLDLDHPLFVDALFIDHVHLWPDGARLLALNLIHELGLPLRWRPHAHEMIHGEDGDRSLVHRVSQGGNDGGATLARFTRPEGVAVSADGRRIVIADTGNHTLRLLRGNLQFVETIAGEPREPGFVDGRARSEARLDHPREIELLDDVAWFIDGAEREHLRALEHDWVRTAAWSGPSCAAYQGLRARLGVLWLLCDDSRILRLDPARSEATLVSDVSMSALVSFDLGPQALYAVDVDGRVWSRALLADGLGPWKNVFRNIGSEPLPHGHRVSYPYRFDDVHLENVVELRYVDRYGGLLLADEFPTQQSASRMRTRMQRDWTEQVHLRYLDLEVGQVLPWIKPLTHGDGHVQLNKTAEQLASYWHRGEMALAQDDASLIWVEHQRSRVLRIADGMLGVAKTGNHHSDMVTTPILTTIAGVGRAVESQMRPDRYLDRRWQPLPRSGPYVALLLGSSLSSMSDRFGNYSFGRRLEQELQAELGYREGIGIDLFQISWPAASFGDNINNFANWMSTSVPPDVVFIEAHDFGRGYLRSTKDPAAVSEAFAKLARLAERYDTLVVFYDHSAIEANRRDGMRSTDESTRKLLDTARRLGFVVLDPGDRLLPRLLMHSPWGNQPFADNQHHGATWAIDITAQTVAAMVAPRLATFLRERVPARLRELPPEHFDSREGTRDPLRGALLQVEIDHRQLPTLEAAYLQTIYVDHQLRVYVDMAGFGDALERRDLDLLAVAVIVSVLGEDVYADLAESISLELVEFENYDEYGNGVIASATPLWRREFDREGLRGFLVKHAPKPGAAP